ncbi:unnamed protein product, partial [Symbiodinium necroappetens]
MKQMLLKTAHQRTRKLPVQDSSLAFRIGTPGLPVGDEKHFGEPQLQKAMALFKKVPKEATYEDLIGQDNPQDEPQLLEEDPLARDICDDVHMEDDEGFLSALLGPMPMVSGKDLSMRLSGWSWTIIVSLFQKDSCFDDFPVSVKRRKGEVS